MDDGMKTAWDILLVLAVLGLFTSIITCGWADNLGGKLLSLRILMFSDSLHYRRWLLEYSLL